MSTSDWLKEQEEAQQGENHTGPFKLSDWLKAQVNFHAHYSHTLF